jgi:hypothetical protein
MRSRGGPFGGEVSVWIVTVGDIVISDVVNVSNMAEYCLLIYLRLRMMAFMERAVM